jgi:hypothetical protein
VTAATLVRESDAKSDGPLTAEHHQELALARLRAVPIRKAARVVSFNAWATAVIAFLSAPFAIFSGAGFAIFVGLVVVAVNEFRGRRRLLQFDPSATTLLGSNQLALLALISLYCLWMIANGLYGESPLAAAFAASPELRDSGIELTQWSEDLYRLCVVGFYGTVIALTVIFQGLTALYYFTRRKYVTKYIAETPIWIRDVQCAGLPL